MIKSTLKGIGWVAAIIGVGVMAFGIGCVLVLWLVDRFG